MSARSLLFGLLIGAAGATGLAFTNSAALGIGPASQESPDAASLFGSGNAAAPGRQQSTTDSPTEPAPTTTSSTTTTVPPTTTTVPTTTVPPTTTAPTKTQPPSNRAPEQAVLAIVNQARSEAGCKPVVIDDRVTTAAQAHSTDMANRDYFSHDTPEGVDFAERMKDAGFPRPGGENIAMGQRTPEQVMQSWMDSPGHRRNILDCSFNTMGLGLDTRGFYWTQDFGR
ncbi:CAP domain-containing protein [Lentzea tibetensis]|uniref:CAP domain-containing protein n=1 Tax=Lentzea tibetensis TaxID=2591470 RepID=UPI001F22505A|nr:CAP domain-containing protein [Lentzea tibetensis]